MVLTLEELVAVGSQEPMLTLEDRVSFRAVVASSVAAALAFQAALAFLAFLASSVAAMAVPCR